MSKALRKQTNRAMREKLARLAQERHNSVPLSPESQAALACVAGNMRKVFGSVKVAPRDGKAPAVMLVLKDGTRRILTAEELDRMMGTPGWEESLTRATR